MAAGPRDCSTHLESLAVRSCCVFDVSNPHPEFAMLPAEYVFVTRSGERFAWRSIRRQQITRDCRS